MNALDPIITQTTAARVLDPEHDRARENLANARSERLQRN